MKNFLKGTLIGSLLISLLIHLGIVGSVTVDWHLKEQWEGLKAAISQIKDKLDAQSSVKEKAETLMETAMDEASQTFSSLMKGKKLRFGPDNESWKKLDEQIALEKAQAEKDAATKEKKSGGGHDPFSRFISPPMEVELVEAPPKPEPEKDSGEVSIEFKKEECSTTNPKIKTYGGIGLQFTPVFVLGPNGQKMVKQPQQFEISIVPKGYPADKAGIMKGDIIEGNPLKFRGEIGSAITVQVVRNGKKINFNMTRVKICYEEPSNSTDLSPQLQNLQELNKNSPAKIPGN